MTPRVVAVSIVLWQRHFAKWWSDPLHARLTGLGATAEQECQALIAKSDIMTKPAGDTQSRAARRLLRHEWQPNSATAQTIEQGIAQLLSDPMQAALAARQMGEGRIGKHGKANNGAISHDEYKDGLSVEIDGPGSRL